jgi:tetratricopeptide (TPR) repeat protein
MDDVGRGRIVTFYSYKGGTGRTMALANIAWILASNGLRVLAVDWDLESPGLHKFFHPFLDPLTLGATPGVIEMITDYAWAAVRPEERAGDWHLEYAQVKQHAVSLDWDHFPKGGTLDFLSAGRQNRDYSSTVSSFEWDNFYDRLGGGKFFDAMREDMKANYDYTLIDSRTGLCDIADICTVQFPNTLVDCFTFSDQSMEGGAVVAAHISDRYQARKIRILPVPMHIDDGEKEKLDAGRSLARARFGGFPREMTSEEAARYWTSVEIPYKAFYAFEETLATFGDEPGSPTSLLAAFERLTAVLTNGQVTEMPALDREIRLHWLDAFTRRRPVLLKKIVLMYAPQDRMWADWVEAMLVRCDFNVFRRSIFERTESNGTLDDELDTEEAEDYRIVAILSNYFLNSPAAREIMEVIGSADSSKIHELAIAIRVGTVPTTTLFSQRNLVDLVGLNRDSAATVLLRTFDQSAALPRHDAESEPRFPGLTPRHSNVPSRNVMFTGRVDLLDRLRDELVAGGQAVVVPQALHGLGGVGKTQVAIEYAYQFQSDYDLIWWVPADQADEIGQNIARLAQPLGIRMSDNVTEVVHSVLEALGRGDVFPRWLLIFDNADGPDEIAPYVPEGPGHIVITSLNQAWAHLAGTFEVDVFSREEAIEHLLRDVPKMDRDDAAMLAAALGNLPLAIEQAGALLKESAMPVDTYIQLLESQAANVLSMNEPADYPLPVVSTWQVSFDQLQAKSPAAVKMLQLLAFFSSGPISMNLLYSNATIPPLAAVDEKMREVMQIARLVQEINRYSLIQLDQRNSTVRVHRLVQAVIRSQLSGEQQIETCHYVHGILTAARPYQGEPDDPMNWSRYGLIWPHLIPSRAIDYGERDIRELLIEWVRYQYRRGEFGRGVEFARTLEGKWTERLGPNDRQTLFLRFHIGNLLRSLGLYKDAFDVNTDVLARQREVLEENHPAVQITAGSVAADLRALGRFREALELAQEAYENLEELLGEDNRRTLAAANNLAVSLRLVGDCFSARTIDAKTLEVRKSVLGPDHPDTLFSAANLARDMREGGEYAESAARLRATYEAYVRVLNDDALDTLRTAKSLAVSLRKAGNRRDAMDLTLATQERYLRHHGAGSPDALACTLNLAADYSALGNKPRARDLISEVISEYERTLGEDHPYTLVAYNNLVTYLRGMRALTEATVLSEKTLRSMRTLLGNDHPFALSCAINLANCLSDAEKLDRAEILERETLAGLHAKLGERHPDTLACEANLAVTLHLRGMHEEAGLTRERVLGELGLLLGGDHPDAVALQNWSRLDRDLEPQPV